MLFDKDEYLNQFKCMNKECGKSFPFRFKVFDGKLSARCRDKDCKAISVKWFMKGKLVFATVIYDVIEGGGSVLPIAL